MFVLTRYIISNRKYSGYVGAIVVGRLGYGKSAYCLKVAYQLYKNDGCTDKEAWEKALECIVFTVEDIVKMIRSHKYKDRAKCIIVDDASVHLNSLLFFSNVHQVRLLQGALTTVRTSTDSLLLNCPELSSLIKSVRKSDDYYIKITRREGGGFERYATGYLRITIPSQSRRIRKQWVDKFSCYIPEPYYSMYMKKRDHYKDKLLDEIEIRMKLSSRKLQDKYKEFKADLES